MQASAQCREKAPPLATLAELAAELGDLKRVRDARSTDSVAARLFRRAWQGLLAGINAREVALGTTAAALAAMRLGAIDDDVLARAGLASSERTTILQSALDQVSSPLDPNLRSRLNPRIEPSPHHVPDFVEALIRQPRAGATRPGRSRLMLEPPEMHGDHCLVVAVLGVILSPSYDADPVLPFLAGLAHHLHNAVLPDAGFAGEMLLGTHLEPLTRGLFNEALATLPAPLVALLRQALEATRDAETSEGRAFNAADVIDRVLQMRHYARVAAFTIGQALDDMELVHAGPLQGFHREVLAHSGLP